MYLFLLAIPWSVRLRADFARLRMYAEDDGMVLLIAFLPCDSSAA